MPRPDVLERALARERLARKQAEQILESKSRELFLVNEQLRAKTDELETQVRRNDLLVNDALDAIITIWSDNTVELFNPEAQRLFGYSLQEVLGKDIRELTLTHPKERRRMHYEAGLRQHISGQGFRELIGQRRDGSSFWIELTARPVSLGGRDALTMIVRDISERRELEKKLRHAQKMESIGQLAAGVAHEINTPVQYVCHNTQFLKDCFGDLVTLLDQWSALGRLLESTSDEPLAQALVAVREAESKADIEYLREEIPLAVEQSLEGTNRVARIVNAMKQYSHPGGSGAEPTDLNAAIESTVLVTRNEWKYVAQLELDLVADLPLVSCNADEFNQVMVNLIVNASHAVAARHSSSEDGLIRISTMPTDGGVKISVGDNGTGIPEDVRGKVFDPFFTTKSLGVGTGQGLALAYTIITERHYGRIEFETSEGEGTTFHVQLPVETPTLAAEPHSLAEVSR